MGKKAKEREKKLFLALTRSRRQTAIDVVVGFALLRSRARCDRKELARQGRRKRGRTTTKKSKSDREQRRSKKKQSSLSPVVDDSRRTKKTRRRQSLRCVLSLSALELEWRKKARDAEKNSETSSRRHRRRRRRRRLSIETQKKKKKNGGRSIERAKKTRSISFVSPSLTRDGLAEPIGRDLGGRHCVGVGFWCCFCFRCLLCPANEFVNRKFFFHSSLFFFFSPRRIKKERRSRIDRQYSLSCRKRPSLRRSACSSARDRPSRLLPSGQLWGKRASTSWRFAKTLTRRRAGSR